MTDNTNTIQEPELPQTTSTTKASILLINYQLLVTNTALHNETCLELVCHNETPFATIEICLSVLITRNTFL